MDQPLTTLSAAADQAASNATYRTAPFGRARATLPSRGAARLPVLAIGRARARPDARPNQRRDRSTK
jgi:hypothetical protein